MWTPALFQGRPAELNKKNGYLPWNFKNPFTRRQKTAEPPPLAAAIPEPSVPAPERPPKPTQHNRNEDSGPEAGPPLVDASANHFDEMAMDTNPILADAETKDATVVGGEDLTPEETKPEVVDKEAGPVMADKADASEYPVEGGEFDAAEGEREAGASVEEEAGDLAGEATGKSDDDARWAEEEGDKEIKVTMREDQEVDLEVDLLEGEAKLSGEGACLVDESTRTMESEDSTASASKSSAEPTETLV